MNINDLLAAPTTMYRFLNTAGVLLYVGISVNFEQRAIQHRGDKTWWPEVASWQLAEYPCRLDAAVAERDTIIAELPLYNTTHHPDGKPSSRVHGYQSKPAKLDPKAVAEAELIAEIDRRANHLGIPDEHVEVMKREALIDLRLNPEFMRAIPRIVTTDEYQKALAYQAKRQARGVSPKLPQGAA